MTGEAVETIADDSAESDGGTESLSSDASQGETESLGSDEDGAAQGADGDDLAAEEAALEEAEGDLAAIAEEVAAVELAAAAGAAELAPEAHDAIETHVVLEALEVVDAEEDEEPDLATFASLCEAAEETEDEEMPPGVDPTEEGAGEEDAELPALVAAAADGYALPPGEEADAAAAAVEEAVEEIAALPATAEDGGDLQEDEAYEQLLQQEVASMEGKIAQTEAEMNLAVAPRARGRPAAEAAEEVASALGGAVDFLAEVAAARPDEAEEPKQAPEPAPTRRAAEERSVQELAAAENPPGMGVDALPTPEPAKDEEAALAEEAMRAMLAGDMERYAALNVQLELTQKEKVRAAAAEKEATEEAGMRENFRTGQRFRGVDAFGLQLCADFRRGRCYRDFCRFSHGEPVALPVPFAPSQTFEAERREGRRPGVSFDLLKEQFYGTLPRHNGAHSAPSNGAAARRDNASLATLLERPLAPPAADAQVTVVDPSGTVATGPARCATLEEAGFPAGLLADLRASGQPAPTDMQQHAWPLAASRVDLVVVADPQEGIGAAFLLPAFAHIARHHMMSREPALLVVVPTQERAQHLEAEARKLGRSTGVRTVCCHDAAPKQVQSRRISMGVHCVIGTPSRVWDLIAGGELSVASVSDLVIDEADLAVAMGSDVFITPILPHLPEQRRSSVFSASWSLPVLRLALSALTRPAQVHAGGWAALAADPDVAHILRPCAQDLPGALLEVLGEVGVPFGGYHRRTAVVFCATEEMCVEVAQQVSQGGAVCHVVAAGAAEAVRRQLVENLQQGAVQVLVSTSASSLAAGPDFAATVVVNVGAPESAEEYIRRACLTGTLVALEGGARERGLAVTLVPAGSGAQLDSVFEVMRRMAQPPPPEVESLLRRAAPSADASKAHGAPGAARERSRSRRRRRGPPSAASPPEAPAKAPAEEDIEELD